MMDRNKRGKLLIFCLLAAFELIGCTAAENYALKQSKVTIDEDYVQYDAWKKDGILEDDGSYPLDAEKHRPQGSVCVTFADNPHIQISYYSDEARTRTIDTGASCYLMPGEYIYSSVPVCDEAISDMYHFARFCIYAWNGNIREKLNWETTGGASGFAFQIPTDYSGTEISIVPVGAVSSRSLSLKDCMDDAGNPKELNGTWIVNDVTTYGTSIEINPIVPLKVEYQYDENQYCFVSSSPDSYYHEKGKVIFETIAASEEVETFSVQLRSVEDERFLFNPAEYTFDHGTVAFYYQGMEIAASMYLNDGDSLNYKVTGTDEGYYSPKPDGAILINTAQQEETGAAIRDIPIYQNRTVLVHLPEPSLGGTIQYSKEGKTINENCCDALPGTEIELMFDPWNGWITNSDCKDGIKYTVTDEEDQLLHIDGVNLNQVFLESSQHKPEVTVVLKDGIMPGTQFDIAAAGIPSDVQTTDLTYSGGNKNTVIPDWLGQNDRCIFDSFIGTEQGITLTAKKDTLTAGMALRLEIQMTDNDKKETSSVRYLTKLPCSESIEIYQNPDSDTIIYKEIRLIISQVEVVDYESLDVANGSVKVSVSDVTQSLALQEGDVLEPSRQVSVSIYPDSGYYITGSKVTADCYSDTMKYSEWIADYEEILEKHPIQRFLTVTLDAEDPCGICVYELDGKEVSGTIRAKEGQELTLTYTLTDTDYEIVRSGPIGVVNNVLNKNSEDKTIKITEALDGGVIRRSDYIQIERKED